MKLIDKDALVAEIDRRIKSLQDCKANTTKGYAGEISGLKRLLSFLDTLEVKDPYEQCVQYDSIKTGIQAHAETYSFNIESMLFPQLTKEQQKLWRKEIEQAVISGGEAGVELARDPRYKENLEVKEVDLEEEFADFLEKENAYIDDNNVISYYNGSSFNHTCDIYPLAKHFFELGLKAQKGE